MKSRITSKGQVTLPIKLRTKLGLRPGDEILFDESAAYIRATKVIDEAKMRKSLGLLKKAIKNPVDRELEQLRGKVELP